MFQKVKVKISQNVEVLESEILIVTMRVANVKFRAAKERVPKFVLPTSELWQHTVIYICIIHPHILLFCEIDISISWDSSVIFNFPNEIPHP